MTTPPIEAIIEKVYDARLRRAQISEPAVHPGMIVKYQWSVSVRVSPDQLLPVDQEILKELEKNVHDSLVFYGPGSSVERNREKIEKHLTRSIQKEAEAFVSKVLLQKGAWLAYLDGFSEPVPASTLRPVRIAEPTAIFPNVTYELTIPEPNSFWGRIFHHPPQKKLLRVLTQSALEPNSLVYLSDLQGHDVYAVSSALLARQEYKRDLVKPEVTTQALPREETRREVPPLERSHLEQVAAREIVLQAEPKSSEQRKQRSAQPRPSKFSYPVEIADMLGTVIQNQQPAIVSVSTAVYDHLVRPAGNKKSNILIIGPTGTGKTELARQVSELLEAPFAEAKLAGKSTTGYIGDNLAAVFGDLFPYRNNPAVHRAVIFLDEIDKLAEKTPRGGFGSGLQNELIGWIEDADINAPMDLHRTFKINTREMLFMGAGAFVGLEKIIAERLGRKMEYDNPVDRRKMLQELYAEVKPEDLETFGLKPELIGRFPVITYTLPLDVAALIEIMKTSKKSAFVQQLNLLQQGYGLAVTVDESVYQIVAQAAQQLGTGARGLETISVKLFEDIKFNIHQLATGTSLTITTEMAQERLRKYLPQKSKR